MRQRRFDAAGAAPRRLVLKRLPLFTASRFPFWSVFAQISMIDKPSDQPSRLPRTDAAMDALAWAAKVAERADTTRPTLDALGREDFESAMRADARKVRGYLDRVVMGSDPEAGLRTRNQEET